MLKQAESLSDFLSKSLWTVRQCWNSVAPFPEGIYQFYHDIKFSLLVTKVDIFLILLFASVLFFIRKFITENFSKALGIYMGVPKAKLHRLYESVWFFTYYSASFSIGAFFLVKYNLLKDRGQVLIFQPIGSYIPIEIWLWRLVQTGNYVQGIYCTLFVDKHNLDFYNMLIHHIITIVLQLLSYGLGFVNSGIIVEVLHDVNDVLLHISKIFNYFTHSSISNKKLHNFLCTFMFLIFAASWLLTRVVLYSYYVLYAVFYNSLDTISPEMPFSFILLNLFALLSIINNYWLFLILRIVIRFVANPKSVSDIREDSHAKLKTKKQV